MKEKFGTMYVIIKIDVFDCEFAKSNITKCKFIHYEIRPKECRFFVFSFYKENYFLLQPASLLLLKLVQSIISKLVISNDNYMPHSNNITLFK